MSKLSLGSTFIARLRARRRPAAARRGNHNGETMSTSIKQSQTRGRPTGRNVAAFITYLVAIIVSSVPFVGFTTTSALACACGCSVFDVGGLDLPQEQDHGGRVFFEFWSGDQSYNWIGSSKAPGGPNSDSKIFTR